jgi:hypothetical protein
MKILKKSKFKIKVECDWGKHDPYMLDRWCNEKFGPPSRASRWRRGWIGHSYHDENTKEFFYFRNHRDATLFILKWS